MVTYTLGMETASHKINVRTVLALLGGVLGLIPVGTAYTFGNFAPYIVSYIRNRTDDTSLRNVDSLWVGAVASVSQCAGVTFGGVIDRHLGPRVTIAIGGLIFSGSTIITYFFVKMSFVGLVIFYGLIQSVGGKIVYGISVQTAIKWLPHKPSLAAGLILTGYGAGALVFNQVITAFINPDNLSPDLETDDGERYFTDPDLLDRVPYCFVLLGFIFLAMQIIGVVAVTLPPKRVEPITTIAVDQTGRTFTVQEQKAMLEAGKVIDNFKSVQAAGNAGQTPLDHFDSENVQLSYPDTNGTLSRDMSNPSEQCTNEKNDDTKVTTDKQIEKGKVAKMNDASNDGVKTTTERNGVGNGTIAPAGENDSSRPGVREIVMKTLRTRNFYVVWLIVLCFSWALRYIASLYKMYGQTFINDDEFLALAGTLSSIFNSLGRPIWGAVMDKYGYRVTLCCISAGFSAACGTLVLTEHFHKAFFLVWICVIFAMYSGVWAVSPAVFARLYGVENTAINYGFIFIATSAASIGNLVVGTTLKDIMGYHGMFFLSAGLGIVPFPLVFLFNGVDTNGKRV